VLVGRWWSYRAKSIDGNKKDDLRVDKISVCIGALLRDRSVICYSICLSAGENDLLNAFIRDLLQCIVANKLVEARIITHTESKVRTGASVVVEGLELVGDRFIESQVNVAIVSIPEFYYNDIASIAVIAVIAGIDGIAGLDGNRKVDLRVENISVLIGAFLVEFSCKCYSV